MLGRLNKSYAEISSAYSETLRQFEEVLKEKTGLTEELMKKFFSTRINDVFDAYKGNDTVLDFIKSIHPEPEELTKNLSIEEILKSRFSNGHFLRKSF